MKKTKILTIALMLATLAGCGKDKGGNIHILAERMSSNSKVLVDPTNIPGGAEWVVGEYVKLNGGDKTIQKDETSGAYYLDDTENMTGSKLAFYPGQDIEGKCDIEFDGNTMLINSLSVVFDGTGKHHMAFPMVAKAKDGKNQLLFKHLTGGFLVTLKNKTGNPVSVASLKIIAQSESAQPLGYTDGETYTAKWAVQGPAVPTGNVGDNEDHYSANYCSEMNFKLKSGGNDYATIGVNGELQFCIPITISKVDKLVVIGYDDNDNQLFKKQKAYTNTVDVVRNHMYDIPPIEF